MTGSVDEANNLSITVEAPSGGKWATLQIDAIGDFAVLNAPAGAANLEVGYWDRKEGVPRGICFAIVLYTATSRFVSSGRYRYCSPSLAADGLQLQTTHWV